MIKGSNSDISGGNCQPITGRYPLATVDHRKPRPIPQQRDSQRKIRRAATRFGTHDLLMGAASSARVNGDINRTLILAGCKKHKGDASGEHITR